jgi:hypothetical protein
MIGNLTPSISGVVHRALGAFDSWSTSHRKLHHPKLLCFPTLSSTFPTAWFDGDPLSNGLNCGVSSHMHLSKTSFICWILNGGPGSNTKAEMLGAWASLLLVTRHNLLDLKLLGDSKIIIEWLNSRNKLQVTALLG